MGRGAAGPLPRLRAPGPGPRLGIGQQGCSGPRSADAAVQVTLSSFKFSASAQLGCQAGPYFLVGRGWKGLEC